MNYLAYAKKSFEARIIQPWTLKHYSSTSYGRKICTYKDAYKGKECFLIGNGPSLRAEDLTLLYKNHIPTFACNRIYNIFEQTPWRPTFYISQDEKMLSGCSATVNELDIQSKWIPIQLNWYYGIDIRNAIYFNMVSQPSDKQDNYLFSDDASAEVYNSQTVLYTAAQLAAYMGFHTIYLIGVDHHFHISQNNQGEIVVDNTVKDYFSEEYNKDRDKLYIPNTEKSIYTYIAMKRHCHARGIRVYNATRGGRLEVFDRVNFEEII